MLLAPLPIWKNRGRLGLGGLIIVAIITLIYWGVHTHQTIDFDDAIYVTDQHTVLKGLNWETARWAFANVEVVNWHPVTWLSHLLDQTLFPRQFGWQIAEGVFWHTLNSLLFWALLTKVLGRSLLAWSLTLIFACHSLNVESVAWLSQRKNQLGLFFLLLTVLSYLRFRSQPSVAGGLCVAILYALSLMSKAMGVPLSAILFLYEWRMRGGEISRFPAMWRSQWPIAREALLLVSPLLAMTVVMSMVTYWAQAQGGAVVEQSQLPFPIRFLNALASYGVYLRMFFVPGEQAIFYPISTTPKYLGALFGLSILILLTCFFWREKSEDRHKLLFGWMWFVLGLLPVIGFIHVGRQSHADRYMYFPMIGLLICLGILLPRILRENCKLHQTERWTVAILAAFALGLASQARAYLFYWKDASTSYERSLTEFGAGYPMLINLTVELLEKDEYRRALVYGQKLHQLYPENDKASYLAGVCYFKHRRYDEARERLMKATELNPKMYIAWLELAFINLACNDRARAADAWAKGWAALQAERVQQLSITIQIQIQQLSAIFGGVPESSTSQNLLK